MGTARRVIFQGDSANANGLQIPSCDDKRTIQISDLNSGLRSIYTVKASIMAGSEEAVLSVQGQR